MSIPQSKINEIQGQLINMLKLDQEVRMDQDSTEEDVNKVDVENTNKLKEIVKEHGWIDSIRFGEDAAKAAWFIVQHADKDLKFQKYCLSLMQAINDQPSIKRRIAYLTDRILVAENKPQLYGTQLMDHLDYLLLRPVEDMPNLNQRRLSMDLETIEEYKRLVEQSFGQDMYLSSSEVPNN